MGLSPLDLEPQWKELKPGDHVTCLADVIVWGGSSGKHLCRSCLTHQFFVCYGKLSQVPAITVFRATVCPGPNGIRVDATDCTVLQHQPLPDCAFGNVVETCSGLGFLGEGLCSSGFRITVSNDLSAPLCSFLLRNGRTEVIEGNFGDPEVLAKVHAANPTSAVVSGGFSCQPWSALGDRRRSEDPRSDCLIHILKGAYLLRAHSIILECVSAAGHDEEVQKTLTEFCRLTGFANTQTTLELLDLCPARRNRWWCILTSKGMPKVELQPLPKLAHVPVTGDVLPFPIQWPVSDLQQLELDTYESRKFEAYGGILSNLVREDMPLKTGLHGWGNQLSGCPCLCRKWAMDEDRLASRGLHGALFLTQGNFETSRQLLPCTRHIHPIEMAACHGASPKRNWHPSLKLSLCGLGQMASPVQSCWVGGHLKAVLDALVGNSVVHPAVRLYDHFRLFFRDVGEVLPDVFVHPKFQAYCGQVTDALRGAKTAFAISCAIMPLQIEELPKDHITSHRTGRKDLKTSLETNGQNLEKQPATGTLESEKTTKQPADGTPGPRAVTRKDHKQPAGETPGLTDNGMPMIPVHATPLAPSPDGPSPRPWVVAGFPSHVQAHAMPQVANQPAGPSHVSADPPRGVKRPAEPDIDAAPVANDVSHVDVKPRCSTDFQPKSDGGLSAFATRPSQQQLDDFPRVFLAKPAEVPNADSTQLDHDSPSSFTASLVRALDGMDSHDFSPKPIWDDDDAEHPSASPQEGVHETSAPADTDQFHHVQIYHPEDASPVIVKVHHLTQVGSIEAAEGNLKSMDVLVRANDAVGCAYKTSDTTTPFQEIYLRNMHSYPMSPGSEPDMPPALTSDLHMSRQHLLTKQEAWVATDEFIHYLGVIATSSAANVVPPCVLPPHTLDDELVAYLQRWEEMCKVELTKCTRVVSAILVKQHWFPIYMIAYPMGYKICCTPEGRLWMQAMLQERWGSVPIHVVQQPHEFANDCGFQAIAWLSHLASSEELPVEFGMVPGFQPSQAAAWRTLYAHALRVSGTGQVLVCPSDMRFGGVGKMDVIGQLQKLLTDHGVPTDQVSQRADEVLNQLGRSRVTNILRSEHAWRDLKSAASSAVPKLQLVLGHELNQAIKSRVQFDDKFGAKKIKSKGGKAPPLKLAQPLPDDVQVPEGIFKDAEGNALSQIPITSIGPTARGVIVLTADQAMPYIKNAKPVSCNGLAILVVDHGHTFLHGVGQEIRFPAICKHTLEPMLVTTKMIQIGSCEVSRNLTAEAPIVDEVSNAVLKVVVYRDEVPLPWQEFTRQPVKEIIKLTPALQRPDVMLDVWDRHYLSARLTRTQAAEAAVYTVSFRLTDVNFDELMQLSGTDGVYYEPRSIDGRSHAAEFRVIWLNRTAKPQALLAMQSTTCWTCLVRSGDRFGLRTKVGDAARVHEQHKPSMPFLDTSTMTSFLVGPMPFGATRTSILKLFKQWGWPARPIQPAGRSADGRGINWEVQASSKPQYDVYQAQHADMLICELPKKGRAPTAPVPLVQSSAKTLEVLRSKQTPGPEGDHADDLWETSGDDPWKHWTGASKAAKRVPVETKNLDAMATQIEQKVLAKVSQMMPAHGDDSDMHDSTKVQHMETRLGRLEQEVANHHKQQMSRNVEVDSQFQQIRSQVEAHGVSIQSHVDKKFQEQLAQIEGLLLRQPMKE